MKNYLTDKQLENYAKVLFWGLSTARKQAGKEYKSGDIVLVNYDLDAIPLLEKLYPLLMKKDFHVRSRMMGLPSIERAFYKHANKDQLGFLPSWAEQRYEKAHGSISLIAPASRDHLKDINPERMTLASRAIKPLRKIRDRREPTGEFAWTLCMMPTRALAEKAEMKTSEYAKEIAKACRLDESDPVASWEETYRRSKKVRDWLNSLNVEYFHIRSEAGTDLKVYLGKDRQWIGTTGYNIPSAEIFTCPDCRLTEGVYVSNMPSFRDGNTVKDIRLVFKKGKVVEASASAGEEFLKKQLEIDEGAKMLGEFSMTDKRSSAIKKFMANTLFDENIGGENGNVHIAIGTVLTDSYAGKEDFHKVRKKLGFNESTLHWDIVDTSPKTVTAHLKNGKNIIIYKDGMFQNDQ